MRAWRSSGEAHTDNPMKFSMNHGCSGRAQYFLFFSLSLSLNESMDLQSNPTLYNHVSLGNHQPWKQQSVRKGIYLWKTRENQWRAAFSQPHSSQISATNKKINTLSHLDVFFLFVFLGRIEKLLLMFSWKTYFWVKKKESRDAAVIWPFSWTILLVTANLHTRLMHS